MSVSDLPTATGEPEWTAAKSLAELGAMLSLAQLHVTSHHHRNPAVARLTDLMGALMLAFLTGHSAQSWRPYIVDDLRATIYVRGCCKWRD